MPEIQKEVETGTTTVGIVAKEGVVLAADRRATAGTMIAHKRTRKVYKLDTNLGLTTAGLVGDLQQRIRDLPEVDTAAKLRALVGRVEQAMKYRTDVTIAATQLEQAANAALDKDPWVLLHRTAAQLLAALNR